MTRNLEEADVGLRLFLKPHSDRHETGLAKDKKVAQTLTSIPLVAHLTFANAFFAASFDLLNVEALASSDEVEDISINTAQPQQGFSSRAHKKSRNKKKMQKKRKTGEEESQTHLSARGG